MYQYWKSNWQTAVPGAINGIAQKILHLWSAFGAGEAWFEIYVEAQYIPLAAAHVAFGLLRKNKHMYIYIYIYPLAFLFL